MINFGSNQKASWLIGIILAILAGLAVGFGEWLGALGLVAISIAWIVFLFPESAFIASVASIVLGQVIRIPIGGEASVIPNDLLLPPLIIAWVLRRLASRSWIIPPSSLTWPVVLLTTAMGLSLILNRGLYPAEEFLTGALYTIRWLEYLVVLWMGYEYVRTRARAWRYVQFLVWTGIALAGLGFIQLRIFPDFSFMVPQGWDPHVGRLLSTWFDPNFLAGYFAFLTTICLGIALEQPLPKARWWWAAVAVLVLATVLTFSRSGYVALAAGAGFVTLMRARWAFVLGAMACVAIVAFVPRVQERVIGIRTIDETAQLRLVSWNNARMVIEDHPVFGVGYNLYRYQQVEYGFLEGADEHSASGSDSSLLTIWVTTGLVGLVAFGWLMASMFREAWRTWHHRELPAVWRGYGLGLAGALLGLYLHSQFVNSLVYPHIMQAVWLALAIAIMVRQKGSA